VLHAPVAEAAVLPSEPQAQAERLALKRLGRSRSQEKSEKIFEPFCAPPRHTVKRRMDRLGQRTKEIVMFKRTLVSGLIATTVAAGTVQPSAAHSHHHNREIGIGIAAGVGGFVLGSLLSQQPPQPVYVDDYGGGSWHVRRCLARYSSYDPGSDTYIGYDGYPHYCRL
jgi:hypothetical protein